MYASRHGSTAFTSTTKLKSVVFQRGKSVDFPWKVMADGSEENKVNKSSRKMHNKRVTNLFLLSTFIHI